MSCVDLLVSWKNVLNIKFVIYDGIILWFDYKLYFEVCVKLGKWDEIEKGLYFFVFLRGSV